MPDLRSIRYVVSAARARSFRKASEELGVRQPALSRTIRAVEDKIGVSLFERHSGGIRLTHAGERFVSRAQRILIDIETLNREANRAGRGESGHLTIGLDLPLSIGPLGAAIGAYRERFPDVAVRVVEDLRSRLTDGLKSRAIDISVMGGAAPTCTLETMTAWTQPIMVVLPVSHALASRDQVRIEDLARERILLNNCDTARDLQRHLQRALSRRGEHATCDIHDVSAETVTALVELYGGISFLFNSSGLAGHPNVVGRALHDGETPCSLQLHAYWDNSNDNPALRRFVSFLKGRCSTPALALSTIS